MQTTAELSKKLDEPLIALTHPSGMRIRIARKPGFSRVHAVLTARFGSVDRRRENSGSSTELPAGLAHFLEHQMFEDEGGDIAARFARLGASSNAFTSFVNTSYVFDASDFLPECLDLLLALVLRPHFTSASVAKEVLVIAREIRMVEDDPGARIFQNLLRALYSTHPVRVPIAGTEASIATITPEMLMDAHRAFYRPDHLALAVVGDVDPNVVFAAVDRALGRETATASDPAPSEMTVSNDEGSPAVAEIRATMEVARPKWLLGFKDRGVPAAGMRLLEREIATSMLLDILFSASSTAHEEWLRSGVIDDTFAYEYTAESGFGFLAFASDIAEAPARGASTRLEDAIGREIERVRTAGVDEADFARIQRRQIGRFVSFFDHLDGLATALSQLALYELTPLHWIEAARSIRREDLEARACDLFDRRFASRSLVLPSGVES